MMVSQSLYIIMIDGAGCWTWLMLKINILHMPHTIYNQYTHIIQIMYIDSLYVNGIWVIYIVSTYGTHYLKAKFPGFTYGP